ncbi:hypothetical protein [Actinomadura rubrisoli]|uniref:hypothetical protein n=1 Tax=Actinomadura rubrisoli TaxID=2530368 RepID=UPI001404C4EF|nr:hypothetical protein [Actinomadura rubrisoli]
MSRRREGREGADGPPDRARHARRLRLDADGRLYDPDERRFVEPRELCDDIRSGRTFRAYRAERGDECTNEILVRVLLASLTGPSAWAPPPPVPASTPRGAGPPVRPGSAGGPSMRCRPPSSAPAGDA